MSSNPKPTLWIIGTPLDDTIDVSPEALKVLRQADVIVGERRKTTFRWMKELEDPEIHLLDPPRKDTWELLEARLEDVGRSGGSVALLSDGGMPILWDPGKKVLHRCRRLGFTIQSRPAATSWGAACAMSGFSPPFLLAGFPPQKKPERAAFFQELAKNPAHSVLMDTPYRYELLLQEAARAFGSSRLGFLAWEVSKPEERLEWLPLGDLARRARNEEARKGEFILIVAGRGRKAE